jgi:RimJ/RimL family protein N-acetyltransferase
MKIVDLKTSPATQWKQSIINHYPFPPYWWLRGITAETRKALMSRELEKTLATEKACILGYLSDAGDLLGFAQMHWLEWDTRHFGKEIWHLDHLGTWPDGSQGWAVAEALTKAIVQVGKEQGIQNIQTRLPLDNLPAIHALEGLGFRIIEILTTWIFDFAKSPVPAKQQPELIRDFRPNDGEALIELARTVYSAMPDRFHLDAHLSAQASDELYAEWMRNSCSGQMADHIAVAEMDGVAVGYSTLKYFGDYDGLCNARIARLGLGAMAPQSRNGGLVTDALIHHLEWLDQRQADFCLVGTQGNNIPPQRVWLRVGFKPATVELYLHFWIDD